jgi:hypothetical protein
MAKGSSRYSTEGSTFYIEGLDETKKALRAAGKEMRKEIRAQFKAVGNVLAEEAKSIATAQGLVGTQPWDHHKGRLVKSIHPTAGAFQVVVNETARGDDKSKYRYPQIYEYGGSTHVSTYKKGEMQRSAVRKKRRSKTATRLGLKGGADVYHGSRAFMYPALKNKEEEIMRRMEYVTKKAAETFKNGA